MNDSERYLIIIPAYNEEMNITEVLKKVKYAVRNLPADILVMDDGSADQTADYVNLQKVQVIKLLTNMGNGGAVQTGFKYAKKRNYKYVVLFDADGQHDAPYIEKLIDYIEKNNCDMVIGSRYVDKSIRQITNLRELGTRFFSWIATKILKTRITDCTSGFRVMNNRTFSYLAMNGNYPQRYPDADFIISLGKKGYIIEECPVIMHERKQGLSMHRGIIKPVTYTLEMLISVICAIFS